VTRIVCQQLAPQIADLAANHRMSVSSVRRAVAAGADIVVLPELVTSGYVLASRAEAASVAISPAHQLFADWAAEAARGPAVVVGGFCERGSDGLLYNSAALVDGTGVRGVYRKTDLWNTEKLVFESGSQLPPVLDTAAGRIGILICHDHEFPEMTRTLALAGAQLIAVPANWPLAPRPRGEHPPEVIIAMAAARTNRTFIACCDRTGTERGQEWTAGTAIIDESGWIISTANADATASADVDLSAADGKAVAELSDASSDRRPQFYSAVSATTGTSARATSDVGLYGRLTDDARVMLAREPLVLLAGMLGDADVWDDIAARLADRAAPQVCRIDLDDSVPEMAESVLAAAPEQFALAGHSLGAIVALEVVRQAPQRVTRLALLNSSARPGSARQLKEWAVLAERTSAGGFAAMARELALANLPENRRGDGALVDRLERMTLRVGASGFLRQLRAQASRPDSRPFLPAIAVATVVVSGALDEVSPGELQHELATGITGSRLVTIEGAGHMSMLEAPAAIAEVLETWLSSPPRPRWGWLGRAEAAG
jgi:predicted amidohydrolase/pimeloyl-ACP methyl ester carboxylesterase